MNCAVHNQTEAAAYCRTCGKALCEECKRDVMGVIYCEPCIAARISGTMPAADPAHVSGAVPIVVAPLPGTPNPGLATLLGFIPGVGAMYNGQFMKALMHVVITAGLISILNMPLPSGLDAFFGIMLSFFWVYMVFDANRTAHARQLGLPAPDPFGLNRMFGIQDEAYVPPVSGTGPAAGVSGTTSAAGVPVAPPAPEPARGVPTGAVVLIGLGFLFLLQTSGLLRIGRLWPLFLIGMGIWMALKRTGKV